MSILLGTQREKSLKMICLKYSKSVPKFSDLSFIFYKYITLINNTHIRCKWFISTDYINVYICILI